MDLIRHLECFVAVAEESHFGRAAARLGMAQPPLSQRIQRLERELGVRLFDRTSRQVAITKGGSLLLEEARELLFRAEALRSAAHRIRDGESGLLRAALPPDVPGEMVAAVLVDFRRRHREVELELRELTTAAQLVQLAAHELDVGFIHHPCDVAGLELGPVMVREVGVLIRHDAPAAAGGEVPLAALSGHDLVLFHRTGAPALHDDVLTTCARNGYAPSAVRQGEGVSFVHGLIRSANAVAFSPREALVPDEESGPGEPRGIKGSGRRPGPLVVWRPLAGAPLAWRYSAAWPRDRGDAAVRGFAEAATEALRSAAGARSDQPARPLHLRPNAEYWV